jgi:membrane protein implicated in regulation of membrane protease activity
MAMRIVINGKEITNPYIKALLVMGAIIVAVAVAALVIFILLPVIGIAVTLSVGFIVVLFIAALVSAATLALVVLLLAWMLGAAEFHIERSQKRRDSDESDLHED